MKTIMRNLSLLALLCLSLPLLIARFRPPSALALELQRQLTDSYYNTEQLRPRVLQANADTLEVYLPVKNERAARCAIGCLPSTITEIWRLQPGLPLQLEVRVQTYSETAVYDGACWSGRRDGQLFRWQRPTRQGPMIDLIGYWMIYSDNRDQVKNQVMQTIRNSGFGDCGADRIGWLGNGPCNSRNLLLASQFRPETLLEQLDRFSGFFEVRLYQGPGRSSGEI